MNNWCQDCRGLTSGDCGKHNIGVRDVEMVYANKVTLSATEYRNLLGQIDRLKAALMAAGVPLGTVERIAQYDGTPNMTEHAENDRPEEGSLEWKMAAAILFMPEIGHLTAGVTKEIVRRCARVATEHFDGGGE